MNLPIHNVYIGRSENIIVAVFFNAEDTGIWNITECLAFHSEHPKLKVELSLNLKYSWCDEIQAKLLNGINIMDLVGNGDNLHSCNKGIGSTLVSSSLSLIGELYNQTREKHIKLRGELSDKGDTQPESHNRRVHFWQKNGLAVRNPKNRYSLIYGKLSTVNPIIPPEKFRHVLLQGHHFCCNDYIPFIPWEECDGEAFNQLINTAKIKHSYDELDEIERQISVREQSKVSKHNIFSLVLIMIQICLPLKKDELSDKRYKLYKKLNKQKDEVGKIIYEIDSSNFGLITRAIQAGRVRPLEPLQSLIHEGRLPTNWANSHEYFRAVINEFDRILANLPRIRT